MGLFSSPKMTAANDAGVADGKASRASGKTVETNKPAKDAPTSERGAYTVGHWKGDNEG